VSVGKELDEEVSFEVKGIIVPYDLPSENVLPLMPSEGDSDEDVKRKGILKEFIRTSRIRATYYLHRLGILATNSVILVPVSKIKEVDSTIQKVNEIYKEVNSRLEKEGFSPIGYPIIKKIPIVQTQIIGFKELAERQLKQKLDEKIESIAKLIQKIKEGIEEGKLKKIKYNVNRTRKEIEDLEKIAKELGIEADDKFSLLGEMIGKAIEMLG